MAFLVLSAIFRKTKHCYQSLYSFLANMGTHTQEVNLHIFLLWGMTEMQWLHYTQSLNLYKTKSCKNTKIVYTCAQLEIFFLTWSPKIHKVISLLYGVSSCGKGLNHPSKCKYKKKTFHWHEGSKWYFVADHDYLCRLLKIMDHFTVVCSAT